MTKADLIGHLVALLKARVLDPEAAIEAAWSAGFREADDTHAARMHQNSVQMQALAAQGRAR